MDLNLHATAPGTGGTNSASEKKGAVSSASDFSLMLARHFEGSPGNLSQDDLPAVSAPRDEPQENVDRETRTIERQENETSRPTESSAGAQSEAKELDAPSTVLPVSEGAFTEASLSLASMPGFLSTVDPLGNLNFADPTAPGMEVIPADVRARLAGQIAANFTVRQGTQTLTLKLEPEHLGKVEVRMQADGDRLSVRLLAANREAESALRENLKDLTDAIRNKTGKYQQVDVRVELKSTDDQESKGPGQDNSDEDAGHPDGRPSHGNSNGNANHRNDGSDQESSDHPWASAQRMQGE